MINNNEEMEGKFSYFMEATNKTLERLESKLDGFSNRVDHKFQSLTEKVLVADELIKKVPEIEKRLSNLEAWRTFVLGGSFVVGIIFGACFDLIKRIITS